MRLILLLMLVDFTSGLLKTFYGASVWRSKNVNKNLPAKFKFSSSKMAIGLCKKTAVLICMFLAIVFDRQNIVNISMSTIVRTYIIIMELGSIIENIGTIIGEDNSIITFFKGVIKQWQQKQ